MEHSQNIKSLNLEIDFNPTEFTGINFEMIQFSGGEMLVNEINN